MHNCELLHSDHLQSSSSRHPSAERSHYIIIMVVASTRQITASYRHSCPTRTTIWSLRIL